MMMTLNTRKENMGWMLVGCAVLLCVRAVTHAGTGSRFDVSVTEQPEGSVSVASDGTNFLVGIQGNEASSSRIWAQLISPTGTSISGPADTGRSGGIPTVGFGGGKYLVIWGDDATSPDDDIYGQLVNTSGATAGSPFPICTATNAQAPSILGNVAWGGTNFLVVWEDTRNNPGDDPDIYGRLVSPEGFLMGPEIPIAIDNDGQNGDQDTFASAAFDGTNYLVVFVAQRRPSTSSSPDIYGQFVSQSGTLVGTNFVIDANDDFPSDNPPAVIFAGTKYIVLFHEFVDQGEGETFDVWARFVRPTGTVQTNRMPVAASAAVHEQFPSIATDGTHVFITHFQAVETGDGIDTNGTVRGRFYDLNLSPLTPWFTVCEPIGPNSIPIVGATACGPGKFMVVLPAVDTDFNFLDVYGVFVDPNLPEITHMGMDAGRVALTVTNLFAGCSNSIERSPSLTATSWDPQVSFPTRSAGTNWMESAPSGLDRALYRLTWK